MTISGAAPRRDAALDALRTLAILLMIASHTTRLIAWDERREWSRFSLLIEPLTASLFLYLVGTSLAVSWGRAAAGRAAWLRKQGLRALALWAVSGIFYTLEEGFHFPDAVFLSGILATIAYSICLVMLLVSAPRPGWGLAAVAAGFMAWHVWLDRHGLRWFFVNSGNSPILPLTLFAVLGAWVQALTRGRARPALVAAAAAAAVFAYLVHRHGFTELFTKPFGRYDTTRILVSGPPHARVETSIPYYNLRPVLTAAVFALILLIQASLASLRPLLERVDRRLFRLGRHSLDAYILHLFLLALLIVISGVRRPLKETWQGDLVFVSILLACHFWALARDRGFPGLRGRLEKLRLRRSR